MPQKPPRRFFLTALALILIALIPFAIIQAPNKSGTTNTSVAPVSYQPSQHSSSATSKSTRHSVTRTPKAPTHRPSDLKNFYLPPRSFKNVSLEEAFEILLDDYYAICESTGESPIRFKWSIQGNSRIIPYLQTQKGFHAACRLLSLLSGTQFEMEGDKITFTELTDEEVTTRIFTVPPTFTSYLNRTFSAPQEDPFAEQTSAPKVLSQMGLINETEAISYSLGEGRITVTGSGETQWAINELVQIMSQDIPIQTRLRFSDLHQDQDNFSPSVILRPYTRGLVPSTILGTGRTETYQKSLSLVVNPHGLGEKVDVQINAIDGSFEDFIVITQNDYPDQTYPVNPGDSAESRTIEIQIPDATGKFQTRTLTLQRIDATGRAVPVAKIPPE